MTTNAPTNRTLRSNTTLITTALERLVSLFSIGIDPSVEESNMAIITPRTRAQSPYKVARLKTIPGDPTSDVDEANSRVPRSRRMQSHRNEARAVSPVPFALWVRVRGLLGVRDMTVDPELGAGHDFAAADRAICR